MYILNFILILKFKFHNKTMEIKHNSQITAASVKDLFGAVFFVDAWF